MLNIFFSYQIVVINDLLASFINKILALVIIIL